MLQKQIVDMVGTGSLKFQKVAFLGTMRVLEMEAKLPAYEGTDGISLEYKKIIFQFGYITIFSSVGWFLPLLAFLNNVVEEKTDAYKLLINYKRPVGEPNETVMRETLQSTMSMMLYTAAITNPAIYLYVGHYWSTFTGCTSQMMQSDSGCPAELSIFVFAEHILVLMVLLTAFMAPAEEEDITFLRRKAEFDKNKVIIVNGMDKKDQVVHKKANLMASDFLHKLRGRKFGETTSAFKQASVLAAMKGKNANEARNEDAWMLANQRRAFAMGSERPDVMHDGSHSHRAAQE